MISNALSKDANNQPLQLPSGLIFYDGSNPAIVSPIFLELPPASSSEEEEWRKSNLTLPTIYLVVPENSITLRFRALSSDIFVSIDRNGEERGQYFVPKGEEARIPCIDGFPIGLSAAEATTIYFAFEVV